MDQEGFCIVKAEDVEVYDMKYHNQKKHLDVFPLCLHLVTLTSNSD